MQRSPFFFHRWGRGERFGPSLHPGVVRGAFPALPSPLWFHFGFPSGRPSVHSRPTLRLQALGDGQRAVNTMQGWPG